MIDYKEIIKSFKKEDYENKRVNLHIHTNYSDGLSSPDDIVRQAKEKGYEVIAIADHNTVNAYIQTDLSDEQMVIPAVEFDVWCGYVFIHLLAYGIDVNNEELKPFFAKSKKETEWDIVRIFSTRNLENLISAIHKAGGIAVLAHPACCWAFSLENLVLRLISYGIDGMEVYYPYRRHRRIIKFHSVKKVEKLADKYNLIKTGGTDFHGDFLD